MGSLRRGPLADGGNHEGRDEGNADGRSGWARALETHSGIVTAVLGVVVAVVALATALVDVRSERDGPEPETAAGDEQQADEPDPAGPDGSESGPTLLADLPELGDGVLTEEPVSIDGTEYLDGLTAGTVYPQFPVLIDYDLGRDYDQLSGTVALADDTPPGSSAVLGIFIDGQPVLTQPLALGRADAIEVDLRGALRLTFELAGDKARVALVEMELHRPST